MTTNEVPLDKYVALAAALQSPEFHAALDKAARNARATLITLQSPEFHTALDRAVRRASGLIGDVDRTTGAVVYPQPSPLPIANSPRGVANVVTSDLRSTLQPEESQWLVALLTFFLVILARFEIGQAYPGAYPPDVLGHLLEGALLGVEGALLTKSAVNKFTEAGQ